MDKWFGSAGVCLNANGELLMVLQGQPWEKKAWAVPSGGKEPEETFEECCIREIKEETGYDVRVLRPLHIKIGESFGIKVEVHYFAVEVVGGKAVIQDPDGLIYEVAWKSLDELYELELSFPEDRDFLISFIEQKGNEKQYLI